MTQMNKVLKYWKLFQYLASSKGEMEQSAYDPLALRSDKTIWVRLVLVRSNKKEQVF